MPDNVIVDKADIIERCIKRAREELIGFRNLAVHQDRILGLAIVCAAIEKNLDGLLWFSAPALRL